MLASVGVAEAGDDLDNEIAADFDALLRAGGLEFDPIRSAVKCATSCSARPAPSRSGSAE